MTTERGEEWDAVRREVLGGTEGCARGEATKRLGSSREISHKYDDAQRRGDEGREAVLRTVDGHRSGQHDAFGWSALE